MTELGPASEDEMVLAFLRAEVESSRYSKDHVGPLLGYLSQFGFARDNLIDRADLSDAHQNGARAWILSNYRGYRRNELLFRGFPTDTCWRRVSLEPSEFGRVRYANVENWLTYSGRTRRPSEVVANLAAGRIPVKDVEIFDGIVAALRGGKRFPELVAVQGSNEDIILLEGHSRATAYVWSQFNGPIEIILGTSPSMWQWAFY